MKLVDILDQKAISVNLEAKQKNEVIEELVQLLCDAGHVPKSDKEKILNKIKERESLGSTGIGKGVGIPHAKSLSVKKMLAAIGISKDGLDFRSLDGDPTHIFFLLIAPGENPGPHLKILAKISRLLDDKYIRDRLRSAKTSKEIFTIIKDEEQKQAA